VTFTYTGGNRSRLFAGAGSPRAIRRQLASSSPELAEAGEAAAESALGEMGQAFFGRVSQLVPAGELPTWVTKEVLEQRAHEALVFEAVEIECEDEFAKDELKAILCHPLAYVPVTRKARLEGVVDRCRVALRLARPTVRLADG
jgi:hypothetical protein